MTFIIPDWLRASQDKSEEKRSVACMRCGRVWWLTYRQAVEGMQDGRLEIRERQKRVGEVDNGKDASGNEMWGNRPGKFEAEQYLVGVCYVCDKGLRHPTVEQETAMIKHRMAELRAMKYIDPELVADYAINEYQREFDETFYPAFADWHRTIGWALDPHPFEGTKLPEEFLGEEQGWGDGSPKCPHVNPPVNWDEYHNAVGYH